MATGQWRAAAGAAVCAALIWATPAAAQEAAPAAAAAPDPAGDSCTLTSSVSDAMAAVLREKGVTVPGYGALCARLNSENLGVDVAEYANAQWDETNAVVMLRLYDRDTRVRSLESEIHVATASGTDDAARSTALADAYNGGLEVLAQRLDAYLASVNGERTRLFQLYARPVAARVFPVGEPCQMRYASTPAIGEALARWQGLPDVPGFEDFCRAMNARGVALAMAGDSQLREGRSRSWAMITTIDGATGIAGGIQAFALGGTDEASESNLDPDLRAAVGAALGGLIGAQAQVIADLEQEQAHNRQVFAPR